jgi:hypothetical protein
LQNVLKKCLDVVLLAFARWKVSEAAPTWILNGSKVFCEAAPTWIHMLIKQHQNIIAKRFEKMFRSTLDSELRALKDAIMTKEESMYLCFTKNFRTIDNPCWSSFTFFQRANANNATSKHYCKTF